MREGEGRRALWDLVAADGVGFLFARKAKGEDALGKAWTSESSRD